MVKGRTTLIKTATVTYSDEQGILYHSVIGGNRSSQIKSVIASQLNFSNEMTACIMKHIALSSHFPFLGKYHLNVTMVTKWSLNRQTPSLVSVESVKHHQAKQIWGWTILPSQPANCIRLLFEVVWHLCSNNTYVLSFKCT